MKNIILALLLINGCAQKPQIKEVSLIGKEVIQYDGKEVFILALEDGDSQYVDFEEYNKYKKGDTIRFWREENSTVWKITNKK